MRPSAPPGKGLIEKVALSTLVGLAVLALLGVTLVTVYVNRLSDSTAALSRVESMPSYVGRPNAVVAANGNAAMNFLVLVTVSGSLHSVVVANLSASRRDLTLITIPADLQIDSGAGHTLSTAFAMDPSIAMRTMEGITGARMDYQIRLDLQCLSATSASDGVELSGGQLVGAISISQPDISARQALAAGQLIRDDMIRANDRYSVLDPSRYSKMIDALAPCLAIDAGLTDETIRNTVIESSVHPDDTRLWPLATVATGTGSVVDAAGLEALRAALASPDLSTTDQYHQAAFLPEEPRR